MAYFPIFIEIEQKKCVILGGGKVALRKAQTLLRYGADVHIVSREVCKELRELLPPEKIWQRDLITGEPETVRYLPAEEAGQGEEAPGTADVSSEESTGAAPFSGGCGAGRCRFSGGRGAGRCRHRKPAGNSRAAQFLPQPQDSGQRGGRPGRVYVFLSGSGEKGRRQHRSQHGGQKPGRIQQGAPEGGGGDPRLLRGADSLSWGSFGNT